MTGVNGVRGRKHCFVCNTQTSKHLSCVHCQAVYYCSETCQHSDADDHQLWCSKMASYSTDVSIRVFPFHWAAETTSAEFDITAYIRFLDRMGVTHEGLWQREMPSDHVQNVPYGELELGWNPYVLPSESVVLEEEITNIDNVGCLSSWHDYYIFRGFRLDSPICILLHWTLTLYYIISSCLPTDYPGARSVSAADSEFVVHCIGAAREADMTPVLVATIMSASICRWANASHICNTALVRARSASVGACNHGRTSGGIPHAETAPITARSTSSCASCSTRNSSTIVNSIGRASSTSTSNSTSSSISLSVLLPLGHMAVMTSALSTNL